MTLDEYIHAAPASKSEAKKRKTLTQLMHETKMSYSTLWNLANKGTRLKQYDKARVLSEATGGRVSIKELCTPAQDRAS